MNYRDAVFTSKYKFSTPGLYRFYQVILKDVEVIRYFDPYNTRIAPHFLSLIHIFGVGGDVGVGVGPGVGSSCRRNSSILSSSAVNASEKSFVTYAF